MMTEVDNGRETYHCYTQALSHVATFIYIYGRDVYSLRNDQYKIMNIADTY